MDSASHRISTSLIPTCADPALFSTESPLIAHSEAGDGNEDATGGARSLMTLLPVYFFSFLLLLLLYLHFLPSISTCTGASKRWRFRRKDKPTTFGFVLAVLMKSSRFELEMTERLR